jgi:hypothetical protein
MKMYQRVLFFLGAIVPIVWAISSWEVGGLIQNGDRIVTLLIGIGVLKIVLKTPRTPIPPMLVLAAFLFPGCENASAPSAPSPASPTSSVVEILRPTVLCPQQVIWDGLLQFAQRDPRLSEYDREVIRLWNSAKAGSIPNPLGLEDWDDVDHYEAGYQISTLDAYSFDAQQGIMQYSESANIFTPEFAEYVELVESGHFLGVGNFWDL